MIIPLIVEMEVLTDELLFPMEIEVQEPLYEMEVSTAIEVAGETPVYDGDYEFVPSEEQQTINIMRDFAKEFYEPICQILCEREQVHG